MFLLKCCHWIVHAITTLFARGVFFLSVITILGSGKQCFNIGKALRGKKHLGFDISFHLKIFQLRSYPLLRPQNRDTCGGRIFPGNCYYLGKINHKWTGENLLCVPILLFRQSLQYQGLFQGSLERKSIFH